MLKMNIAGTKIIFTGVPVLSGFVTSKGEPYYELTTKDAVMVRCSTHPALGTFETNKLFVRESDLNSDQWRYEDAKKPELGFWMENWVADFSVNQKIPLYQATSIRQYIKGERGVRREEREAAAKEGIVALVEKFKASKK